MIVERIHADLLIARGDCSALEAGTAVVFESPTGASRGGRPVILRRVDRHTNMARLHCDSHQCWSDYVSELFCEARMATLAGLPVVWVGRRCLTSYRAGVRIAEDLDDAIGILFAMANARVGR